MFENRNIYKNQPNLILTFSHDLLKCFRENIIMLSVWKCFLNKNKIYYKNNNTKHLYKRYSLLLVITSCHRPCKE